MTDRYKEFREALTTSKYFNRILGAYDTVLVTIGGSRALDIDQDNSDYDLNVFVTDPNPWRELEEVITWKGKTIHWYYNTIDDYIKFATEGAEEYGIYKFGIYLGGCIDIPERDLIVWQDETRPELVEKVLCYKHELIAPYINRFLQAEQESILSFILKSPTTQRELKKFLYHAILFSYTLLGDQEQFEADKDTYLELKYMLKRIQHHEQVLIPPKHIQYAKDRLTKVAQYFGWIK